MSNSNVRNRLDEKHQHDRERRLEAIKRWVEYIKTEPPGTWGPQQNAIVDEQLTAAQATETSATHRQHVQEVAAKIIERREDSQDSSE